MRDKSAIRPDVRPYLPSNGSEGLDFMAIFCDRCKRESDAEHCVILDESFMAYPGPGPKEWLQDITTRKAWCTEFDPRDDDVRASWQSTQASQIKEIEK
jgi:hypothetical protein